MVAYGCHLGRNSRNPSMPPGSDDLPGRVLPRREPRKGATGGTAA
jgi:hypothetical protein